MSTNLPITARTKVKRLKERASYDQSRIFAAIDDALFATIAFYDGNDVHAIPTAVWRERDHLYIHGSNASRLINFLQTGAEVCVSITHLDGVVLARSALHHSMNYRSVCIYGNFECVVDANKEKHMQYFLEHWMPGRWQFVRRPTAKELATVTIMLISINEAALKSREGHANDLEKDLQHPVWAGIMPLKMQWQTHEQIPEQKYSNLPGLRVREFKGRE